MWRSEDRDTLNRPTAIEDIQIIQASYAPAQHSLDLGDVADTPTHRDSDRPTGGAIPSFE